MRRFLVVCLAVAVALSASATVRKWNLSTGGKFNNSSNWNPSGVPSDNDELVFNNVSGEIVNDISAVRTFAKLTFTGTKSFTISGKKFKLGSGGILSNLSSASAQVTVSAPFDLLYANTPFAFTNSNHICGSVAFKGVISGVGGIFKTGSGSIYLYANNTFQSPFYATGDGYTESGQLTKCAYDHRSEGGPATCSGVYVGSGIVHIYASTALGPGEARIGWNTSNYQTWMNSMLYVHGPVTITTKTIFLPNDRDNGSAKLYLQDGNVTIMSDLPYVAQSRVGTDSGSSNAWRDHYIYGDASSSVSSWHIFSISSYTRLHYMQSLNQAGTGPFYLAGGGQLWLHGPNNTHEYWYPVNAGENCGFVCATNRALTASSTSCIKFEKANLWIDLGGYDQALRCTYLNSSTCMEPPALTFSENYGFKSDKPAVLWFEGSNGVVNAGFHGQFKGAAGLGWDVRIKRGTFTYSNTVSTTRGKLVVSNGWAYVEGDPHTDRGELSAIKLANGASFTALSKIELHRDRLLYADEDSGGGLYADEFWSDWGGLMLDCGQQLVCKKAVFRDKDTGGSFTNLPPGVYTYDDFPDTFCMEDTGASVRVLPESWQVKRYEWTGRGADKYLTTAANWKGGKAPDFTDGSAQLVFNSGKGEAIVKGRLSIYGIEFATNRSFTVSGVLDDATGDAAALVFYGGGVTCSNTASSVITYTLANSVALEFPAPTGGKWPVPANVTLDLRCPMSGAQSGTPIEFTGAGTVNLRGDNRDMKNAFRISCTKATSYHPWALGAGTRDVKIDSAAFRFATGAGLTNNAPIQCIVQSGVGYVHADSASSPLCLNGLVKLKGTADAAWSVGATTFAGGIRRIDSWTYKPTVSGASRVSSEFTFGMDSPHVPMTINSGASFLLGTTNVSWNLFSVAGAGWFRCGAKNCLLRARHFDLGRSETKSGNLDLQGFDQTLVNLRHSSASAWTPYQGESAYAVVTSGPPAVVTIETTNDWWGATSAQLTEAKSAVLVSMKYRGQAALTYRGIGEYWLCNQKSDSKGALVVESGKVGFKWGAGWSGPVTVKGTGKLVVDATSANKAFGDAVDLVVEDDATVELPDASNVQTVRSLVIDGMVKAKGTYTANQLGYHFSGVGTLKVLEEAEVQGLVIIFE